jgi:hypothetical protein
LRLCVGDELMWCLEAGVLNKSYLSFVAAIDIAYV